MKPVLQALVLAERVYEVVGGQKVIAGTFNGVKLRHCVPEEPVAGAEGKTVLVGGRIGSPYAYISLTDVGHNTELQLQFVSLGRNVVLFETKLVVQCDNRLATVEVIVSLPLLHLPEPGTYAFEVVCEGEVIGSHRVIAKMADEDNDEDDPKETSDGSIRMGK